MTPATLTRRRCWCARRKERREAWKAARRESSEGTVSAGTRRRETVRCRGLPGMDAP
uniref:Uncharacterized protein n=1 Tax=Arundo donax TaxID=35708 RepID=A0A0A9E413_ARUDO